MNTRVDKMQRNLCQMVYFIINEQSQYGLRIKDMN